MMASQNDFKIKPGAVALVTGATGVIGPPLVAYLQKQGVKVRAFVLPGIETRTLFDDVEIFRGDICNPEALEKAVQNVDLAFHLAAKLHINDPDSALADEYEQINVEGTRQLVKAAEQSGVSRLVFFSTINVYGVGDADRLFTEESALAPQSLYAKTKSKAEQIVLSARSESDGKPLGVVLRLAAVYGPGMRGNYLSLLSGLKQGWFLPIGPGQNRRTLIYLDDAVQAAFLAAGHPRAVGNIYNLTDGQVYSLRNIIDTMCEGLGRRSPRIHLPVKPIRFGFGLIEDFFLLIGRRFPFGRQTIDAMLEDRAVSGQKIKQDLGFQPRIELIEGWRRIIKESY